MDSFWWHSFAEPRHGHGCEDVIQLSPVGKFVAKD